MFRNSMLRISSFIFSHVLRFCIIGSCWSLFALNASSVAGWGVGLSMTRIPKRAALCASMCKCKPLEMRQDACIGSWLFIDIYLLAMALLKFLYTYCQWHRTNYSLSSRMLQVPPLAYVPTLQNTLSLSICWFK